MKYRLYSSQSEWTSRNESLEEHFGIPNGKGTLRYAKILQVSNPENADYDKYIMPVCTDGTWKCLDLLNPSDLVDFDPTWNPPPDEA